MIFTPDVQITPFVNSIIVVGDDPDEDHALNFK